jgi:hypothetical protein
MKRVSRISSPEEFALENKREDLRDHRADRRSRSLESFSSSVSSVVIATRPVLITAAAFTAAPHVPTLVAEVAKVL